MKNNLTILLCLLVFTSVSAQENCSCEDNFLWVKETFEQNDAGYEYAMGQKPDGAYAAHNEITLKKVKDIDDGSSQDCSTALYEWLTFFRDGHISIQRNAPQGNGGSDGPDEDAIRAQFADWDKVPVDEEAFMKYLSKKKDPGLEGIWKTGSYRIAIKKSEDGGYIGSILKADGAYWVKDQVKLRIAEDGSGVFYMRDHSESPFDEAVLAGPTYLWMGQVDLERAFPEMEADERVSQYYRLVNRNRPTVEKYSDKTVIVRIPTFNYSQKYYIDSVLMANYDLISNTENLILDLRYNGGGSDGSYSGLLPFIYTNPIRVVGVELLSTELNNSRMLQFAEDEQFPESDREWYREKYEVLAERPGEFVSLNQYPVSIEQMDEVMPYPKRVGVLIHEYNGSTTEQFLLAAKQSQKVKLFGKTTAGVLDISNMHFVPSPCGDITLGYSLSRSMRIPDMAIDGKGIAPDYYLDDSIEPWEWIEFTAQILESQE